MQGPNPGNRSLRNICYIAILNHQDEPVYTKCFDKGEDLFELELIAFASLDHFDIMNVKTMQFGGYLSCNCIEDDVYFTYGCYYGTRIKIIIILKNFQCKEVEDVLKAARVVHELYLRERLNPFGDPEKVSMVFENRVISNLQNSIVGL